MTIPTDTIGECSTGDITFEDSRKLDQGILPLCIFRNSHGYILYLPEEMADLDSVSALGFSDLLKNILIQAKEQGLRYLRIDGDAPQIQDEPDPSWENAKRTGACIKNPAELTLALTALDHEELVAIATHAFCGLFLDSNRKGDFINPDKNTEGYEKHMKQVFHNLRILPAQNLRTNPHTVLQELVADVEAVGVEKVKEDWPDLLVTYKKAKAAIKGA